MLHIPKSPLFFLLPLSIHAIWAAPARITEGSLITANGQSVCPLKHTGVQAEISGALGRVTVTQEFQNPFPVKIEAVYAFPLPPDAAIDDMTMLIGERTIRARIKRREEARAIYDAARKSGHVAGLLDQERPNIFTQAVANIMPGAKVRIAISYVETVPYESGQYRFEFPMVVGPRYIPGSATGKQGGGWAPDTDQVPDASRITPLVTPEGTRAGHDISIEVKLDAGMPLESLESPTHDTAIDRPDQRRAVVRLKDKAVIPNKDFILKYSIAGRSIGDAVLTHYDQRGGFFTLLLQPPERVAVSQVLPKELIFVLDTSGSMGGFPIEKAKETMSLALDGLHPQDTFNLITFSGDTHILFPQAVAATAENLREARAFLQSRYGSGGTEMMKAIRAALEGGESRDRVRVVCFMTDGEVGNDLEILAEVQKHPNTRVFAFGIGSSVNHFLLDNMARYGRGEVDYVGLNDDGSAAARRFHERVRNPLLTDVSIDWNGLPVTDIYPKRIPDLFSARPVMISGRYTVPGQGTLKLHGRMAGHEFAREVHLDFAAAATAHDVVATLWARQRVEDLMGQDLAGAQRGALRQDLREQIVRLGLDYRLMTQFTSMVAVEEKTVTEAGEPQRIEVPVEMPDGVSYEGVFGNRNELSHALLRYKNVARSLAGAMAYQAMTPSPMSVHAASAKLHPWIATLMQHGASGHEAQFVRDGKAAIQVYLSDTSPETLAQLRALGFEVTYMPKTGSIVAGRIATEKLEALAKLSAVKYVAPRL